MIPYGKQTIDEEDIKEVLESLKGDFLTTGPKVDEFEKKVCDYIGCKYAVAVSNGTAALHLACLAGELKQNEELITSPITFAASANCALYCNARPVFVDVKENGLIDENKIENKINSKTKIIIPVHYSGLVCNMEKIKQIADRHKITVIEDACHSFGGKYKDSKVGDCKYSDMTIFSFHPVKHITTGEGGIITTNSLNLYKKLKELRNHGIVREKEDLIEKNEGPWFYEMQGLGFNYRLTDFQCALGISQLNKIDRFIDKRLEIAKKYDSAFADMDEVESLTEEKDCLNVYHLYVIKLKDSDLRGRLFDFLKQNGISCQVHYIPVYFHPYYKNLGYKRGICPNAENFYGRIISLPIYPSLKKEEQEKVIKEISTFFNNTL